MKKTSTYPSKVPIRHREDLLPPAAMDTDAPYEAMPAAAMDTEVLVFFFLP